MPVYNTAKYLRQAISSVLNETFTDFELLICNDASTDNSKKIIDSFAKKDKRIKVYTRRKNSGKVSKVCQFLASKAKGEYLAPTDSDDICLPHRLKTLIKTAEKNPDAVLIYGKTRVVNSQNKTLYFYGGKYDPYEIFINNYVPDGCCIIRRDLFNKINGYNTEITWAEDYDLRLRLGLERRFVYIDKEVYIYRRIQSQNLTAKKANHQETYAFRYNLYQDCKKEIQKSSLIPINYRKMVCLRYISAHYALIGNIHKSVQYKIILQKLLKKDIVTKNIIKNKLIELGLQKGQKIIVHSALSQFGVIAGGAKTIVETLKEIITPDGLIVMPTFTYQTKLLDNKNTPRLQQCFTLGLPASCELGTVAEEFRKSPDTVRTFHPYISFALWGQNSTILTKKYYMHDSMTLTSPVGEIYQNDGYVLVLGADFTGMSILHLAEYLAKVPYTKYCAHFGYLDGKQKKIITLRKTGHSGEFKKIHGLLFSTDKIRFNYLKIGDADCYLIKAKDIVDTTVSILEKKPDFFLCDNPTCQDCRERKQYFY